MPGSWLVMLWPSAAPCRVSSVGGPASCELPTRDQSTCDELMNAVYPPQPGVSSRHADLLRRRPERVTCTLPWVLRQRLEQRALEEGRSLSGLIAYILERSSD